MTAKPVKKYEKTFLQRVDAADEIIPVKTVDPNLAKKLIEARRIKNLTRKQLAHQLSIAEEFIADFETNKKKPSNQVMNKITAFINKTFSA
jgi:ribosome-binding protein aMBF1 (putative translation factor)